ncbi:MAG: AsmA family protein [Thermodesulfobacteria bacterium]|nr:AsmA family protein [Thermodesulfobacteriota bacterium]
MGKLAKILGVVALIFIVLVASVYFLASRYLTPERVKSLVVPPLEEATGFDIQIGEIKRRGFLGVGIQDVRFLDPSTKEKVLAAQEMRLRLSLSPLLKGELVIAEASLVRPEVYLIRLKDGSLNLVRILEKKEKAAKEAPKETKPSRLALVFQKIRVEKGKVYFRDQKKELPPAEASLDLSAKLRLAGAKLALEGEGLLGLAVADFQVVKDLRLQTRVQDKAISAKILGGKIFSGQPGGEVLVEGERIKGAVTLKEASFKDVSLFAQKVKPYFFPESELPELSGTFHVESSLGGKLEAIQYKALVDLAPLETKMEGYTLLAQGKIEADPRLLKPSLDLKINGEPLSLKGQVSLSGKLPRVDLELNTPRLDLLALMPKEASNEGGDEANSRKEKRASSQKPLTVGAVGKIRFFGKEVCYRICGKDVRAELELSPRQINLKELNLLLAGAVTQLNGRVYGLPKSPQVRFAYSLAGADLPLLAQNFLRESNYFTSGKVWSEGTFWGRGLEAELLKKTLNGQGHARFSNLGLKETPLSRGIASLLGMEELKRLQFEKGETYFEVKEGLVDVRGKFSRQGLVILVLGKVGLDGRLNLTPRILFSGQMAEIFSKRFPGASLFKTEKGYEIPLAIAGTFDDPKISLVQEVKEKIKEKAVEKIFKFLGR